MALTDDFFRQPRTATTPLTVADSKTAYKNPALVRVAVENLVFALGRLLQDLDAPVSYVLAGDFWQAAPSAGTQRIILRRLFEARGTLRDARMESFRLDVPAAETAVAPHFNGAIWLLGFDMEPQRDMARLKELFDGCGMTPKVFYRDRDSNGFISTWETGVFEYPSAKK